MVALAAAIFGLVYIVRIGPERLILSYWFVLGGAIAAAYRFVPASVVRLALPVGLLALASSWLSEPWADRGASYHDAQWTVVFVGLLVWMARNPTARNPLNTHVMQWTGLRSYSLYAMHYPVLWTTYVVCSHNRQEGIEAIPFTLLIAAPVSLGLAALTYRVVERPSLAWSRRGFRARTTLHSPEA
jgi:peptidoglycan/LPS O-acetylase OafA/YrhL